MPILVLSSEALELLSVIWETEQDVECGEMGASFNDTSPTLARYKRILYQRGKEGRLTICQIGGASRLILRVSNDESTVRESGSRGNHEPYDSHDGSRVF